MVQAHSLLLSFWPIIRVGAGCFHLSQKPDRLGWGFHQPGPFIQSIPWLLFSLHSHLSAAVTSLPTLAALGKQALFSSVFLLHPILYPTPVPTLCSRSSLQSCSVSAPGLAGSSMPLGRQGTPGPCSPGASAGFVRSSDSPLSITAPPCPSFRGMAGVRSHSSPRMPWRLLC